MTARPIRLLTVVFRLLLAAVSVLLLVGGLLTVTGSAPMMRAILASVSLAREAPSAVPVSAPVPRAAPELVIEDYAFVPAGTTAPAGSAVTVVNRDDTVQIVTAADGSFGSGEIPAGGTGTFTAPATPGTYPFRSGVLPFMTGTLTVT